MGAFYAREQSRFSLSCCAPHPSRIPLDLYDVTLSTPRPRMMRDPRGRDEDIRDHMYICARFVLYRIHFSLLEAKSETTMTVGRPDSVSLRSDDRCRRSILPELGKGTRRTEIE
jgi:hypothetical protein